MFYVQEKQCDQCLFSANRIVSLARMKQILRDCERQDRHFICHKAQTTDDRRWHGKQICCRGFYDKFTTNLIRVAQRLKLIRLVNVK